MVLCHCHLSLGRMFSGLICVVAWTSIPSFCCEEYCMVWNTVSCKTIWFLKMEAVLALLALWVSVHQLRDIGVVYTSTVMNSAAVNICVSSCIVSYMLLCEHAFISPGFILGAELLGLTLTTFNCEELLSHFIPLHSH